MSPTKNDGQVPEAPAPKGRALTRINVLVTALAALLLVAVMIARFLSEGDNVPEGTPAQPVSPILQEILSAKAEAPNDDLLAALPPVDTSAADEAIAILEDEKHALKLVGGGTLSQRSRVSNIASESLDQLVANLAAWDDFIFALTSHGSGLEFGSPEGNSHIVPRLFRVRKLLEQGQEQRELVVGKMEDTIRSVLDAVLDSSAFRCKVEETQ